MSEGAGGGGGFDAGQSLDGAQARGGQPNGDRPEGRPEVGPTSPEALAKASLILNCRADLPVGHDKRIGDSEPRGNASNRLSGSEERDRPEGAPQNQFELLRDALEKHGAEVQPEKPAGRDQSDLPFGRSVIDLLDQVIRDFENGTYKPGKPSDESPRGGGGGKRSESQLQRFLKSGRGERHHDGRDYGAQRRRQYPKEFAEWRQSIRAREANRVWNRRTF